MAATAAEDSSCVDLPLRLAGDRLVGQEPSQKPVTTDKLSAMDASDGTIIAQANIEEEPSTEQLFQPSAEQRDDHEAPEQAPASQQDVPPSTGVTAVKKKKRSKKSKSQRGRVCVPKVTSEQSLIALQNKPTGFEEYYADPPLTPDEYKEERSIYDVYV